MSDILVIKVNTFCRSRELNDIRRYILSQVENSNVVVLPAYCGAPAGVFSKMFGIVEFSDGVRRVDPSEIVFCDEENEILSEMEKMRK